MKKLLLATSFIWLIMPTQSLAQEFFKPADSLSKPRLYLASGFAAGTYSAFSVGLATLWYSDTEQGKFHWFNDYGEWQQVDKAAHAFDAYFQARLVGNGARWTGMSNNASTLTGIGVSALFQTTIEILDGFSEKWGFSWPDMAFNGIGWAVYGGQEWAWGDQRISLKISSWPKDYPSNQVQGEYGTEFTPKQRAEELYGRDFFSRFIKDYNAQTFWISVNPASFMSEKPNWLPAWLNIALGYGADNLYGGFENEWETNGESFGLHPDAYPRNRQFYLSLDIDLSRIDTRSHFWNGVLDVINIIKIPAPTIEYRSDGNWYGHWLH